MLKHAPELPALDGAAEDAYVVATSIAFTRGGLSGMRVLVYQHSAVGRDLLPRILRELGADVVTAGRSETFIPIDTENITDEQLERLEAFAVAAERGGRPIRPIVSTDGDSDRPLVTAVLPRRYMPTGTARALLAGRSARHRGCRISACGCRSGADQRQRRRRAPHARTQSLAGKDQDRFALRDLGARSSCARRKFHRIVGWEANGGFLTGSDISVGGATLAALPTRDATLPILANLFAAAEQGISLSDLVGSFAGTFWPGRLIDNFPVAASQAILAGLIPPAGASVEVEFDRRRQCGRSQPCGALRCRSAPPTAEDWQRAKRR